MSISAISIKGYRSVRNTHVNIGQISTFVGANGVGKTNLYKSLALLQAAAAGTVTRAIAAEGGIESVLWAGERKRGDPARLCLKAHFDELFFSEGGVPYTYEIEIGVPQPTEAAFRLEPMIKLEKIVMVRGSRKITMMERKATVVSLRNADGAMETFENAVLSSESALASLTEMPRERISELIAGAGASSLRALFARAQLPRSTHSAFVVAVETYRMMQQQGDIPLGHAFTRRMIQKVLAHHQSADGEGLDQLHRLLHRLEGEAARDAARRFVEESLVAA